MGQDKFSILMKDSLKLHNGAVNTLLFVKESKFLYTGGEDQKINVVNFVKKIEDSNLVIKENATPKLLADLKNKFSIYRPIYCLGYIPNEKMIVSSFGRVPLAEKMPSIIDFMTTYCKTLKIKSL